MSLKLAVYIVPLFAAALIAIIITIFSWKRRPASGSISLAFLMGSVALWILSQTLQELNTNLDLKIFWNCLKYQGVITTPVAWIILSLEYTKRERLLTSRNIMFVLIIPLITTILVWTNNLHNLFLSDYHLEKRGSIIELVATNQFWFWVHTFYCYLLLLIGIILLIEAFFQFPSIYMKQTGILLSGAFIPIIANVLTIFNLIQLPYVDITPLALLCTGILFFWGLFKYKMLDLVPIARHAVIESMKDLIFVLDNQKRLVDLNPAAKKIVGLENSNIIGQPITSVLLNWKPILDKYKDKAEVNEDIILEDGYIQRHFNLRKTPILDKTQKVSGDLIILRDISELKEAISELTESRKIAESANKAKGQFLANMSHELRTPMNAIIGMSDLLSPTNLTIEQREYLEVIKTSANSLLKIITDIFDFSKTEGGKLELEKIDFNLKNLLNSTINPLLIHAESKGIKLFTSINGNIPEILLGDPVRLKQVLLNLTTNAIKFTFKGQIEVRLDVLKEIADHIHVCISVIDTGIGIQAENIGKLFKSFNQLDNSSTRTYGGIGLGLAITKNLVECMGGNITVESKPGEGSKFSVFLNLQVKEPNYKEVNLKQPDKSITKIPHILLAEDNKVNQTIMLTLLKKLGYTVDLADNGLIAANMSKCGNYDLILMDIQMPVLDGLEATSEIRKAENEAGDKHIPIIALTANATEVDRNQCFKCGMDDYITKPVRSQKLREVLAKYFAN